MAHERKTFRAAVIAQLIAAGTLAGSRVTSSRFEPQSTDTLPAIGVYVLEEEVLPGSRQTTPRELKRSAKLVIQAFVSVPAGGAVDDALDAIALEIETAMDGDDQFKVAAVATASESILASTESAVSLEGARPMGMIALTYDVTYYTDLRIAAPTDLFDTMATTHDIAGAQATADQSNNLTEDIYQG